VKRDPYTNSSYFEAPSTDLNGRLTFYFGQQAGNGWLDAVVLHDTQPMSGPVPDSKGVCQLISHMSESAANVKLFFVPAVAKNRPPEYTTSDWSGG